MVKPDYTLAATSALRTLIFHNVTVAPVVPLPIIKHTRGVLAMPFADLAHNAGIERNNLVPMFGENQDAVTFHIDSDNLQYVVAYNQYLPFDAIRRGLARELGHIILGHDGKKLPTDVRMEEAMTFARHLLFPRPVIHAIQQAGFPVTIDVIGSLTGCYVRCLEGLHKTPGIVVPPELNRQVRDQFSVCIKNFIDFQSVVSAGDTSDLADFGSFMDGYEE